MLVPTLRMSPPPDLIGQLEALRGRANVAFANAMNGTIATCFFETTQGLAKDLGLDPKRVGEGMSVVKAGPMHLYAAVSVSSERLPLTLFSPEQTATGVAYRLRGGQGFVPHAFLATMRSGHQGVFRRRSLERPERRGRKGSWLPIDELRGPSLGRAFIAPRMVDMLHGVVRREFPVKLAREVENLSRAPVAATRAEAAG